MYQQKWTRNLTEKIDLASWVKEMAWKISDDVVWIPKQFFNSFSQHFCLNYFIIGLVSEDTPQGPPSTWLDDVLYCYILYYEVVMGSTVN